MIVQLDTITDLLKAEAGYIPLESLSMHQRKDSDLLEMIQYMEAGTLSGDHQSACKLVLQSQSHTIVTILDNILSKCQ